MLEIKNVSKRYGFTRVLNHVSLSLPDRGLIGIVGASGCGKTTLMHIIGGIDRKYQGKILWNNQNINKLYRKGKIGFLFQQFHLITWLNVLQNVELPRFFKRNKYLEFHNQLDVEINKQSINELSLGQKQRIAYIRAMSYYPQLLLCDEPTASLDHDNAEKLMLSLKEESQKRLVILVSHDEELVYKYSDEIIRLEDGKIIEHKIYKRVGKQSEVQYPHCLKKSILLLSLFSMKLHLSRCFQIIFALTLSLTCILFTFSLSAGFKNQIIQYIDSYIPDSAISFRLKSHSSLTEDDLILFNDYALHSHLYLNDYELIAIGPMKERYNNQYAIEISDDSGFVKEEQLLYGRLTKNSDEIIVSKTTAMHYVQGNDIEQLLNQEVALWYKHLNEVKGYRVKVVGICNDNYDYNCVYYLSNAVFKHIESLYDDYDIKSYYGILYVDEQDKSYDLLKEKFNEYEFIKIGESTKDKINDFMDKLEYILFIFSSLAIISSVFLIGEVMFLEVIDRKKDIAIMKCFSAKRKDVFLFVFYQSFIMFILSVVFSSVGFIGSMTVINRVVSDELLMGGEFVSFDYSVFIKVYLSGLLLLIVSQLIPLIYALRVNTSDCLKLNSTLH